MKKDNKKRITFLFAVTGMLLMLGAMALVVMTQRHQQKAQIQVKSIVNELYSLMPEIQNGSLDDRENIMMSSMELYGVNYVGTIEVPKYNKVLPICDEFDKQRVSEYPCRYDGSVYDQSLIVAGSDQEGQFDFIKWLTGGDLITVTDMTGRRFSYIVTDIERSKDVSDRYLQNKDAGLTIYARNTYSLDYTVVRCEVFKRA